MKYKIKVQYNDVGIRYFIISDNISIFYIVCTIEESKYLMQFCKKSNKSSNINKFFKSLDKSSLSTNTNEKFIYKRMVELEIELRDKKLSKLLD